MKKRSTEETEILFAGTGDRNPDHNDDLESGIQVKRIRCSPMRRVMAPAAKALGMVMEETEDTEQGDTEQDPDGTGHRSEDGGW